MKIPANGFTHAGKFHADDVFATALLQILRPDIKITRGFVVPDDFDGIVYDIGFGMFDHHQEPRETRPNGIPYAAFGLLWQVLGPGLVGERQARLIDENFIQPLDLNDNTHNSFYYRVYLTHGNTIRNNFLLLRTLRCTAA